jgi:hypothetical protein
MRFDGRRLCRFPETIRGTSQSRVVAPRARMVPCNGGASELAKVWRLPPAAAVS